MPSTRTPSRPDRMLPAEFRAWAERVGLSPIAFETVRGVREGDPTRRPVPGVAANSGTFISEKMGLALGVESDLERARLWLLENDPDVLEMWDQPLVLWLTWLKNGRRVT